MSESKEKSCMTELKVGVNRAVSTTLARDITFTPVYPSGSICATSSCTEPFVPKATLGRILDARWLRGPRSSPTMVNKHAIQVKS